MLTNRLAEPASDAAVERAMLVEYQGTHPPTPPSKPCELAPRRLQFA
jgi:hypothetical protein